MIVDIAQILTAVAAIVSIYVAINISDFTIQESGRIGWYNTLETRSIEAGKIALDKNTAKCIYDRSDIVDGNSQCITTIFSSTNSIAEALDYAEMLVELVCEANEYSEEYDSEYYDRWYSQWAKELSKDPHGIVGHAMLLQASGDNVKLNRMKAAGLSIDTEESERRFSRLQKENIDSKNHKYTQNNTKKTTKDRHQL